MRKSTTQKLMWFLIGCAVVVMNIGGLGATISNALGKDITYN